MPIFEEKQYFRQTPFIWMIDGVMVISLLIVMASLWVDDSVTETAKILIIAVYVVFAIIISVGFRYLHLDIKVEIDGLKVRYFPFQLREKCYLWSEIKSASPVTYKPLAEYGGWGIRWNFRTGTRAFTVRGNAGVLLELVDGKRILIGSQQATVLAEAIQQTKG